MARSLACVRAKEDERKGGQSEPAKRRQKGEKRGEERRERKRKGTEGDDGWIPGVLGWILEQRRPKLNCEPSKEPSFQGDKEWSQQRSTVNVSFVALRSLICPEVCAFRTQSKTCEPGDLYLCVV